ncbi:MAG TPA: ABC transporter permease [Desertimonas sp.]|nr:ABC transporter permease [Desertimonas sp.]
MRYVIQRLTRFLIVFFVVTFGVLVLLRLGLDQPGDPARTMLGGIATQEEIDATTAKFHLDENYLAQYWHWLRLIVVDQDFGFSVSYNVAVSTLIARRILITVLLGVYALTLALTIAVPLAVHQAYRRDRSFDRVANVGSFVFVSLPVIVVAVVLKLLFVEHWQLFPRIAQRAYPWDDLGEHARSFALPAVAFALPAAAVLTRLLRADLVLTLQSDFVLVAKAKGISPRRIMWRHALPNSIFTLLSTVGVQVGVIVGGAVVVETFFDLDGMGLLLVAAVLGSDLFTVQAIVALLVVAVVVTNLVVDLLYGAIDPRVRTASELR